METTIRRSTCVFAVPSLRRVQQLTLGGRPAPERLLAIDPGYPDLGAALYRNGTLERSLWVRVPSKKGDPCPPCQRRFRIDCRHGIEPVTVSRLLDELERMLGIYQEEEGLPDVVVMEMPQHFHGYRGEDGELRNRLGAGAHLTKLTAVNGALADRAAAWKAQAFWYWPAEWKGRQHKVDHQAENLTKLSDEERALIPQGRRRDGSPFYRTDPVDAALIGLWWHITAGIRNPTIYASPHNIRPMIEAREEQE